MNVSVVFVILMAALLIVVKILIKKRNDFIQRIYRTFDLKPNIKNIIIVSYKDRSFSEIDRLLTEANLGYTILLDAPLWLADAKKNVWKNHQIITRDSNCSTNQSCIIGDNSPAIINNIPDFLRQENSKG